MAISWRYAMCAQRLGNAPADRVAWVKRGLWQLEDHLQTVVEMAQSRSFRLCHIFAVKEKRAVIGIDETRDDLYECAFPAAAAADEADAFAWRDGEVDAMEDLLPFPAASV